VVVTECYGGAVASLFRVKEFFGKGGIGGVTQRGVVRGWCDSSLLYQSTRCHDGESLEAVCCVESIIIIIIIIIITTTTTTKLQLSCHSMAAVLTPVQTKQTRINIHKRNSTKTQYRQYKTQ
jgi:hypothetical protein